MTAGRKSWTFGKWLGLGVLLLAISLTFWLANSVRTRGDDDSALRNDLAVAIQDEAEYLAFLPMLARGRTALIFICGSNVAAEAYTELLRPVAEAGFAVFVVRLPYRFAPLESHRQIVFDRVRRVMDAHPDVANWVVSGHSLGGALAAGLAAAGTDPLSGLVLIATTHPRVDDLSHLRYPVTVIYATRDGMANAGKVRANRVRLPKHTQWVEIAGGNHAQFGRYGEQAFDDDATISREKQEALTRSAVIRLLVEVDTTLGFIKDVEDIEPFATMGADIIRLWPKWIYANPELVDKVHRLGKSVWATTGDASRDELEKLIKLGVNGIISDRPEVMSELRADMRKCREP